MRNKKLYKILNVVTGEYVSAKAVGMTYNNYNSHGSKPFFDDDLAYLEDIISFVAKYQKLPINSFVIVEK